MGQYDVRVALHAVTPFPPTLSTTTYLEVSSAAVYPLIQAYRDEVSHIGVGISNAGSSGWDLRFNCTDFTDLFLGYAGARVCAQLWLSSSTGQKPAVFALWYIPDRSRAANSAAPEGHSIVAILTDHGVTFVDPQLQDPVTLSPTELASVYHLRS